MVKVLLLMHHIPAINMVLPVQYIHHFTRDQGAGLKSMIGTYPAVKVTDY